MTTSLVTPLLEGAFAAHDWVSAFLSKHLFTLKKSLLLIAHLSLLALLLPGLRQDFGQLALAILLVILFLSPLAKIFRMRLLLQLLSLRRELGILMGYLATVHGIGFLIDPQWRAVFVAPYSQGAAFPLDPIYLLGGVAYFLILLLLFTSNSLMQRFLNIRNWKRLHRLVYVVLPLVLLHQFSTKHGLTGSAWLQTGLISIIYILAKLFAWKNFSPSFQAGINWVATRYHLYTAKNKAMNVVPVE